MKDNPTPKHFRHLRNQYVTIVAFGDSITQINHTTHGGLNWVGYLTEGLCDGKVFPKGHIVINAGYGGDTMAKGLARLDRDVLRFKPDIAILSFGMNDADHITPDEFKKELCEAIHRIRKNGSCTIVLRTPNPVVNMMNGFELTQWLENGKIVTKDLARFAKAIREVAKAEKTLLVDHYSLWVKSMGSSCRGDLIRLMSDPTHPNNLGHRRLYHELAPLFNGHRYFFFEWERILAEENQL